MTALQSNPETAVPLGPPRRRRGGSDATIATRRIAGTTTKYASLIIGVLFTLIPLSVVFIASFKRLRSSVSRARSTRPRTGSTSTTT